MGEVWDLSSCAGFVTLLAAHDGSVLWERNFAGTGFEAFSGIEFADSNFYPSGAYIGRSVVNSLEVSSSSGEFSDAALLVFEASLGDGFWLGTVSGGRRASSLHVEIRFM